MYLVKKETYFKSALNFVAKCGRGSLICINDLVKELGFGYIWCACFLRFLEVCGYLHRVQGRPVVYIVQRDIGREDFERLFRLWNEKNIYERPSGGKVMKKILEWLKNKPSGFVFTVHDLVNEFGGHHGKYNRILSELVRKRVVEDTGMRDMNCKIYMKV